MKQKVQIAGFILLATLLSYFASCQYRYHFDLCGTVVSSVDDTPVVDAVVQVFEYPVPFDQDLDTLTCIAKSTGDLTDASGQYKVYFAGTFGGCRQSIGPSSFDSLYVRVSKSGYEAAIIAVATDEITRFYAWGCHTLPPISIAPGGTGKP